MVIALLVAGAVAAVIVTGQAPPAPIVAMVVGGGVTALLVVAVMRSRRKGGKPRKTPAEDAARRLGLRYEAKGDADLTERFEPLPRIPRSGSIRHVLTGELAGREMTAFQHTYMVHTGQAPITVHHTVYTIEAPPWPRLTVSPRNLLMKVLRRLRIGGGPALDIEAFNAAFKVSSRDMDFALTLLSPELQTFMLENRSIVWEIHPGLVAMIYGGRLRPDRMEESLSRLERFFSHVPPEMEAW